MPAPGDAVPDDRSAPVVRAPILRGLAIVFVGVLFGMAAVDQVVAWVDRDQGADDGTRGIVMHETLSWIPRPHFENPEFGTRLDRFGLRSPEIPENAPRDEVRIAGFGASRMYGAGGARQEWLWNYKLEELLSTRSEHPLRVLNGGVMAYSGLQACRRAAMLVDALEPDLIFVSVSPGAQLMLDPSAARKWVRVGLDPDDLIPADVAEGWPRAALPLVAMAHRAMNSGSGIYRRHRARFQVNEERGQDILRWTVSRAPRPPVADEMLRALLDEAEALNAICRRRNIELRMLVLPENDMDNDRTWAQYLRNNQASGAPPIGTPRREPVDVLEELLRERGIRTWNFFDEVSHMGVDRAAFTMPDNAHWNQRGHEVIARGVSRRIQEEGLLETLRERRAANPRTRAFGPSPFAVRPARAE